MKTLLTIFAVLMLSLSAQASVIEQTARNEHMRQCLGVGGQKDICLCSFDQAKKAFAIEDLLDLNRKLSAGMNANPDKVKLLTKITAKCVRSLQNGQSYEEEVAAAPVAPAPINSNPLALPVPPLPPKFNAPEKQIEPPVALAEKPKKKVRPRRKIGDNTNVDESEYLDYLKNNQRGVNSAHYSEYDDVFFNSVAAGDLQGMIAGSRNIKGYNIKNEQGQTPLMVAVLYNQPISIQFLLEKGAKTSLKDPQGQTALHLVALTGNAEIASYLISAKAKIKAKNAQGQTPLHAASFAGNSEVAQMLIYKKADVRASYGAGFQPIHLAVLGGDFSTIDVLLGSGAEIAAKMEDGNQPVHLTIANENIEMLKFLEKRGAYINAENNIGQTPLHIAVQQNKPYAVQALLQMGANVNALDALGKSPLRLAQEGRNQQMIGLFQTHFERVRLQQLGVR